jgi:hypothetical protein
MWKRVEWIPEKDEHVCPALGNKGADLLIASEWSALQFCYFQIQRFLE